MGYSIQLNHITPDSGYKEKDGPKGEKLTKMTFFRKFRKFLAKFADLEVDGRDQSVLLGKYRGNKVKLILRGAKKNEIWASVTDFGLFLGIWAVFCNFGQKTDDLDSFFYIFEISEKFPITSYN